MGLAALAVAQMGVHLVFFLHITTGAGQHQQRGNIFNYFFYINFFKI